MVLYGRLKSWTAIGVVGLLLACRERTDFVPLPSFAPNTRTIVTAVSDGTELSVSAHPAEARLPVQLIDQELASAFGFELLELESTLESLRLPSGALEPASGASLDAVDLVGSSHRAWTLSESSESATQFSPVEPSAVSPALLRFRAQSIVPPCPSPVRSRAWTIQDARRTWLALPLGDGSGIVGGVDAGLVLWDGAEAGPLAVVSGTSTAPANGRYFTGGRLEDGRLWLVGQPTVVFARLAAGTLVVDRTLPRPDTAGYLFEGLVVSEDEVFVLSSSGQFLRYVDGTWTQHHDWAWQFWQTNTPSGALFRVPEIGAVCAAFIASPELVCHSAAGVSVHAIEGGIGSGISVAGFVPGLGHVVGSTGGEFYVFDGESFSPIGETLQIRSRGLQPFRGGFLVGGDSGYLAYFDPLRGACDVSASYGVVADRIIAFSDTRTVITGSSSGAAQVDGVFIVLDWAE